MANEDREYVERLKNDSFLAFEVLFKKYAENLYAFALSITREPYIAEEITQLVFMKIWEKRAQIEEHLPFKSFIFSVAYSETISWLRKEKSEKRKTDGYKTETDTASNETEYSIEFNNIKNLAGQIIDNFPEKRKEIFKLSREQGYSNREIAARLNISVRTVESQISSALKVLKEKLGKDGIIGLLFYFIMFY
jgi:RNA polymerase sigma-70 factor (ECF subfamily)